MQRTSRILFLACLTMTSLAACKPITGTALPDLGNLETMEANRQAGSYCQVSKSIRLVDSNIPAIDKLTRRDILTENVKHDCLCNTGKIPDAECKRLMKVVLNVVGTP